MRPISRRDALKSVAAASVAAMTTPAPLTALETATRPQPRPSAHRFFNAREWRTLRVLADDIIPRDERSGSATDAKVPEWIDAMMMDETLRQRPLPEAEMRGGLAWLDRDAHRRFARNYADCPAAERHALLDAIAFLKKAPPEARYGAEFFARMRDIVAGGFFSSEVGYKDLRYKGQVFVPHWQGCPDDEIARLGASYAEWDAKYGKP